MHHTQQPFATLLARAAHEISSLSEVSEDLQLIVSGFLEESNAILGNDSVLTLQEMDRLSQSLKALAGLIRRMSETEVNSVLCDREVRLAVGLDSLADRILAISPQDSEIEDDIWFLDGTDG